ncbi:MAG TPA: pyruvate dehydrogenase (acetyl-transferring) E1 component subunit alpha [Thermomicrobiales bacterium]|nr:pyruvate dehydrogenase (acetyl-transferring) E1 component subunit alpha [Thermomicrobiales bacterium]
MDTGQLLDFYRQMYLIRRFEERAAEQYAYGKIGGFLHLYIGEEAVAVGAIAAMTEKDHLFTHYRDHGYALAIGADPNAAMAELFGKETGTTSGRGGSMHMIHPERNFWGGYAIVGGHIPLAVGAGLAIKHKKEDAVSVAIFGDGATNNGAFHEAANMASLWKLPVVFLCENNRYGMGTAVEYASAVPQMLTKAQGHGIEGEIVDGQDVLAMYAVMQRAVEHCKSGKGPYFIEAMTYRFRGHSMADPESYRDREEVERFRQNDPIPLFKQQLLDAEKASAEDFERIEAEVEEVVEEAVRFADESDFPPPSTIYDWVYFSDGEVGKEPERG